MNKDQANEVFGGENIELPQIRQAVRGTKNAAELAAEQDDIENLRKIVAGSFGAIANATGRSDKEVLHTIENIHVDFLKDVMKEDLHVDERLRESVQEAIKVISLATDLDTQQITDIFSAKKDTNIADIVTRLHHRSQVNRESFG